jgi:hypothetical protein
MTPEQLMEIQTLRDRKVTPKQIARKLGLRPAEVNTAIQQQAMMMQQEILAKGELPPLEACLTNGTTVRALLQGEEDSAIDSGNLGLGTVMVVRKQRNTLLASVFLVDYYCLGIKNAASFRFSSAERYRQMKEMSFSNFPEGPEDISLEQAQAIVFGALDYAQQLGFDPHEDFEEAKGILGDGKAFQGNREAFQKNRAALPAIEFGRDGQPFYLSGPYDNPAKVIKTLEKSVGKNNYKFMVSPMSDMGGGLKFLE